MDIGHIDASTVASRQQRNLENILQEKNIS